MINLSERSRVAALNLRLEKFGVPRLMSGIQTYELDPKAACSVPTVEVHLAEATEYQVTQPLTPFTAFLLNLCLLRTRIGQCMFLSLAK